MKKVSNEAERKGLWDVQTARNTAKINEIVAWITEHEKYVMPLEKAWQEAMEQTLELAKLRFKLASKKGA